MCNYVHDGIQSLMVTGFTVIVLHTKISPHYNVLHEAISYFSMETKRCMKNLTCDCTTHHGTQRVCKVRFVLFMAFDIQRFKLNKKRGRRRLKF